MLQTVNSTVSHRFDIKTRDFGGLNCSPKNVCLVYYRPQSTTELSWEKGWSLSIIFWFRNHFFSFHIFEFLSISVHCKKHFQCSPPRWSSLVTAPHQPHILSWHPQCMISKHFQKTFPTIHCSCLLLLRLWSASLTFFAMAGELWSTYPRNELMSFCCWFGNLCCRNQDKWSKLNLHLHIETRISALTVRLIV